MSIGTVLKTLDEQLDGLTWAVTGKAAYQLHTGQTPGTDQLDLVLDVTDYMEAAGRLEAEKEEYVNDSGITVYQITTTIDDVAVHIRTTSIDNELDLIDHIQIDTHDGTPLPIVPPAYLIAKTLAGDLDVEIEQLRDSTDVDRTYLRQCMQTLGIEGGAV